jgi:hypothetical protein
MGTDIATASKVKFYGTIFLSLCLAVSIYSIFFGEDAKWSEHKKLLTEIYSLSDGNERNLDKIIAMFDEDETISSVKLVSDHKNITIDYDVSEVVWEQCDVSSKDSFCEAEGRRLRKELRKRIPLFAKTPM